MGTVHWFWTYTRFFRLLLLSKVVPFPWKIKPNQDIQTQEKYSPPIRELRYKFQVASQIHICKILPLSFVLLLLDIDCEEILAQSFWLVMAIIILSNIEIISLSIILIMLTVNNYNSKIVLWMLFSQYHVKFYMLHSSDNNVKQNIINQAIPIKLLWIF